MNPLYNRQIPQQNSSGNLIQQFNQFKNSFQGDPQQLVQNLLYSGKITQDQLNHAINIANQMKGLIQQGG